MKKIMIIVACLLLTCTAIMIADTAVNQAKVTYRNVTANFITGGSSTSLSGTTPAVLTNTDTSFAHFTVLYNSDLIIRDSIVRTSGYVRGTAKLQGSYDTVGGGKWFTVRGLTTTVVGAQDSVFSFVGTTSQVGVWYVQEFPFQFARLLHMTDTTEVVTTKVAVWGKS